VVFVAACLLAASFATPARAGDPGIEIELDRSHFTLRASDLASGESGPTFPIAMGSPANPTPSGRFGVDRVILNPRWRPGEGARAAGVPDLPPSLTSPMGVAKIPFAKNGEIALHGAGEALLLGKPISSGCVRSDDADLLRLVAWLHGRHALGEPRRTESGEVHRRFRRPVRIVVD
jgi:hypothetical protein